MRCPACRLPLLTVEVNAIELDYCAEDLGVWFDEGEIEALLGCHTPILTWDGSGAKGKRRCPRCNTKMRLFYPVLGLELDICPNGDGLWFDAGEVEQLTTALQRGHDKPHLGQIFSQLNRMIGGQR
ncbi:MAG: hypothetical protein A2289_19340 [Deltaproteobacteria bacterium RIFOXYA12_FULL_58_15]|nr:MAG: hypothetical protein A2289_19340 [Deltaproteobacteria bacterium RIFOXYA12_FULL_58_15]OGR14480.1 MAG: hypothetical protein A2341_04180 [Deltaproteobacteria bacterium RIFOXYB12_FULL_58_9]